MIDLKIFLILFLILLILVILLISKAKRERKEEEYKKFDYDEEEEKNKKILKRILFLIIVGGSGIFFYSNRFLIQNRTLIFFKEVKSDRQQKINLKKELERELEKEEISEELVFSIDDIKYTEIGKDIDMLDILQQPYINQGIFYEDTDKILEKRKTEDREYLYNIKGKGRQYTGELTEKIKNNKIKISKYINGFLMEYRIYDNEIKDKNLVQIKRYYKSGNERLEVLYENGQIVQVKESYDKQGSENYKRITSYKNGKKDGKESFWDNDGRKIKN